MKDISKINDKDSEKLLYAFENFPILKYAYNYTVDNIIKDEVREQIIKDAVERSNIETEDINETINLITGEISRIKTERIDLNAYYSTN